MFLEHLGYSIKEVLHKIVQIHIEVLFLLNDVVIFLFNGAEQ